MGKFGLTKKEMAIIEKAFSKAGGGCVEINGDENKPINQICLYWYTDVGEDWSFCLSGNSIEEIQQDLYDYWQSFDIDEDVELQLQMRGHPSISNCLKNAEDKVEFLEHFLSVLRKAVKTSNGEIVQTMYKITYEVNLAANSPKDALDSAQTMIDQGSIEPKVEEA